MKRFSLPTAPDPSADGGDITRRYLDVLADKIAQRVVEKVTPIVASRLPDEILTTAEAAARLKVPPSWLKSQVRAGNIRSEKWGRYRRFRWNQLQEDLQQLTGG